jgi:hypothetical protein
VARADIIAWRRPADLSPPSIQFGTAVAPSLRQRLQRMLRGPNDGAVALDIYGHLFPDTSDSNEFVAAELALINATQTQHEAN